ncbi:MAG TPA: FHA domain-containing protein [Gemmatimonadaceae bacterium]|nr:FHA domain-containing protein [Gemmatimonadaceae bacterium]
MPRIVLKELETDRQLAVAEAEALIGRDPACAFFIEGPKSKVVSGRHARIFFQDSAWWIQDMSRNGTVLDDERLQAGQRHALRVGQVIGLGESGPRLRVAALEGRVVSETLMEAPDIAGSPKTTAPRQRPAVGFPGAAPNDGTAAMRKSEAMRAGVRFEEPTEPMSPAADWLVQVSLVAANSDMKAHARARLVKIGRSPECNVRIPPEQGASVSRVHAEIAINDGGVVVRDAGSRNGTFVNGNRIESAHHVAKGDQIMLGSGGPVLVLDDLRIVKGDPTDIPEAQPGIGGGPTPPDPMAARKGGVARFREPVTAAAPGSDAAGTPALAGTRFDNPPASPRALASTPGSTPAQGKSKAPVVFWVVIAALIIAAAVVVGRMTAS